MEEGEAVGIMGVVEGDIVVGEKDKRGESGSGCLSGRKHEGWRERRPKGTVNKGDQKP